MVDGSLHHFSAGGLFEGLIMLIDDETQTYWEHITGEGLHGPLRGQQLEVWPLDYTTNSVALSRYPDLTLSRPETGIRARLMGLIHRKKIDTKGFIPPPFRRTMSKVDERLPEHTQGVGMFDGQRARFYPMASIGAGLDETWGERPLRVSRDQDGVPKAVFSDTGERPMQLFSRWYGFAISFPDCEIGPAPSAESSS